MPSADVQGKFLWHELMTTDPAAAGAFYGKVLGWTPQAWNKDPSYTVLLTPKGPVGGMMRPAALGEGSGDAAQWVAYIGTHSVDETVAAAQRLGGRVLKGATDIPGGGRYAILADPQGGTFGVHTPPASGSASQASEAFTWHELATADPAAAFRFYGELFGWEQLGVHDLGAMGPYLLFGRAGRQLGGMFNRPSSMASSWPHWLAYVRVASAAKTADTAKAAGGRVANGPHQVPGGSWIAQLVDPQGAAIAVNQPQATVEAAPPPRPSAVAAAPASRPVAVASRPTAAADKPAAAASRPASPARPAAVSAVGDKAPAAASGTSAAAAGATIPPASTPSGSAGGTAAAAKAAEAKPRKPKAPQAKAPEAKAAGGAGAGRKSTGRRAGAARKTTAKRAPARKKRSAPARASTRRAKRATAPRGGRGRAAGASRSARKTAARKTAARKTAARKTVRGKSAGRKPSRAKPARRGRR